MNLLIVFPDYMDMDVYAGVYNAALAQCEKLKDRFVIMDLKGASGDPYDDADDFRNTGIGMSDLKYGAAYYPDLKSALNYGYSPSIQVNISIDYVGTGTPTGLPTDSARIEFSGILQSFPFSGSAEIRSICRCSSIWCCSRCVCQN